MKITINGYAVVFGEAVPYEDRYILVERHAFRDIAQRCNVEVRWGSHEGPVIAHMTGADFFADNFGLAFSAHLDMDQRGNWSHLQQMVRERSPISRCSLGMLVHEDRTEKIYSDRTLQRISRAHFDHVALVERGAFAATAVWPMHGSL